MTHNENNDIQQQQVLFTENDVEVESANTRFNEEKAENRVTEQVIIDNENYMPIALDESEVDCDSQAELNLEQLNQEAAIVQGSRHAWLWRVIGFSFFVLLVIESYEFYLVGFVEAPITTSIYAVFFSALVLVSSRSLWREFVGLKQFKKRQKVKQQALGFLVDSPAKNDSISNGEAKVFCEKISDTLPCDLALDDEYSVKEWHDSISNEYNATEIIELYSRVVLSKVDDKALNEVAKFSTEAVVLISLSPVALIDMLIMLSRNLRMINKISGLYGLKLSYWSRIKLIKQVFINMAYAGASELVADFGSDMLGAELLGKLSARFGQGLGAGMLTARLGAKTMELCRPIPFKEKPKLTEVRKKIAQQIKSLMK